MNMSLFYLLVITDLGFILYWAITFSGLIPSEYMYKDYTNPILQSWNLSFIPIDLLSSIAATISIIQFKRTNKFGLFVFVPLTMIHCSGLMAISFWFIRNDFDWSWWVPNLFLMIWPLYFIVRLNSNYSK